jgi:hypothetical protein
MFEIDWAGRNQPCNIWFTATMLQDSKTSRFRSKELLLTIKKEVWHTTHCNTSKMLLLLLLLLVVADGC